MRVAPQVELTTDEKATLAAWATGRKTPVRMAERARILLLADSGALDTEISSQLSITPKKVARWRKRFLDKGLAGLQKDAPRPGRTPAIDRDAIAEIVRLTTQEKPSNATHWSTRGMAAAAGISDSSVLRIWHAHGLKPHRVESFKLWRFRRRRTSIPEGTRTAFRAEGERFRSVAALAV